MITMVRVGQDCSVPLITVRGNYCCGYGEGKILIRELGVPVEPGSVVSQEAADASRPLFVLEVPDERSLDTLISWLERLRPVNVERHREIKCKVIDGRELTDDDRAWCAAHSIKTISGHPI